MMFLLVGKRLCFLHVQRLADTSLKWGSQGAEMSFARRRSLAAKQKRKIDLSRGSRDVLFYCFGHWHCFLFTPLKRNECFIHDLTLVKDEMNTAAIQILSFGLPYKLDKNGIMCSDVLI